jgi:Bacterial dnaA protein helix-turn-helix
MTAMFATKPTRAPDLVIAAYVHLRGLDRAELLEGESRTARITHQRRELMWLLRDLTHLGFADIGFQIGGRDQSTVYEGISIIADRLMASAEYRHELQQLHGAILAHPPLSARAVAQTARDVARRVASRPEDHAADTRLLAVALLTVDHLLSADNLSAEDCLFAAQAALREVRGVNHGL